jgi:dihydrofolate reductase
MTTHEETTMAATYTFDVFCTLDGFASYSGGDWGGYWGKQGPEFLAHRSATLGEEQRLVLGADTLRQFMEMIGPSAMSDDEIDPTNKRMRDLPATVVSSTLQAPVDWPDATILSGDAAEIVARLKQESAVPLRSHGSLSLNRSLMAAGLVDRIQLTIFPALTGQTGAERIFEGAADFDLELIESRTFDGRIQELVYRPTLHA